MAELLAEMLPSEAAAATATAKSTAAALIVAEYALSSANSAESKAHIARAATNPQVFPTLPLAVHITCVR